MLGAPRVENGLPGGAFFPWYNRRMAENEGILDYDPTSDIGRVRILSGDSVGVPFDPEKTDDEGNVLGQFQNWSDAEIEGFLGIAEGGVTRAIGLAYLSLASQAAIRAKSVKDYDLQVDLTKRAGELRATATMWFERADSEDAENGSGDIFDVFPTVAAPACPAEAAPRWF